MTDEFPRIAPFEAGSPLVLRPMPNGGWVVEEDTGYNCKPQPLGAYGCAQEMLAALSGAIGSPKSSPADTFFEMSPDG